MENKKIPKMVIKGSEEPQMLQIWIHVTENTEKAAYISMQKTPKCQNASMQRKQVKTEETQMAYYRISPK